MGCQRAGRPFSSEVENLMARLFILVCGIIGVLNAFIIRRFVWWALKGEEGSLLEVSALARRPGSFRRSFPAVMKSRTLKHATDHPTVRARHIARGIAGRFASIIKQLSSLNEISRFKLPGPPQQTRSKTFPPWRLPRRYIPHTEGSCQKVVVAKDCRILLGRQRQAVVITSLRAQT